MDAWWYDCFRSIGSGFIDIDALEQKWLKTITLPFSV